MNTPITVMFFGRRLSQRLFVRLALWRHRRRRTGGHLRRPPQAPPGLLLNNHLRRDIGLPPVNDAGFWP